MKIYQIYSKIQLILKTSSRRIIFKSKFQIESLLSDIQYLIFFFYKKTKFLFYLTLFEHLCMNYFSTYDFCPSRIAIRSQPLDLNGVILPETYAIIGQNESASCRAWRVVCMSPINPRFFRKSLPQDFLSDIPCFNKKWYFFYFLFL